MTAEEMRLAGARKIQEAQRAGEQKKWEDVPKLELAASIWHVGAEICERLDGIAAALDR